MKINNKIIIIVSLASLLVVGCSKNTYKENLRTNGSHQEVKNEVADQENDIPYIKTKTGEIDYANIDNSVIDERYEKVNKEELEYKVAGSDKDGSNEGQQTKIYYSKPIADKKYSDILLGYTYFSEMNPTRVTYEEAINLINKVLPDDIVKEKEVEDTEVNKKYIFYKSDKGNFVAGLCYGYEYDENNGEELRKDIIVGIDYLKEVK